MDKPTHIPLYNDEKVTIEKEIDLDEGAFQRDPKEDLFKFYEIEKTLKWIQTGNYKRVALQFPDHLLSDSSSIASLIREGVAKQCSTFILADTSYGQCCIDEVASEHVKADSLIHYGPACLSTNTRLPVLYIFGNRSWNIEDCASQIESEFCSANSDLLVFYDVQFYHGINHLKEQMSKHSNIIWSQVKTIVNSNESEIEQESESFCGRTFSIPATKKIEDYKILYIGTEGTTLNNIAMKYNQCRVWMYRPMDQILESVSINVNRALMKRFYLIERAKDADIIGIVVGTLAVANYMEILAYLKKMIKEAGKKYYTFIVGKLNIPKLANFAEIDMFVLVACPENSLIDSKDFFKPIVTPFELEIALVKGKEWSNQYSTDFATVLATKDIKKLHGEFFDDTNSATEAEDVRISLVSSKIKINHKIIGNNEEDQEEQTKADTENAIAKRQNLDLALASAPTASTVFLQRSFQGLQQRLGEDAPQVAIEGRSGIACEYDNEGN